MNNIIMSQYGFFRKKNKVRQNRGIPATIIPLAIFKYAVVIDIASNPMNRIK